MSIPSVTRVHHEYMDTDRAAAWQPIDATTRRCAIFAGTVFGAGAWTLACRSLGCDADDASYLSSGVSVGVGMATSYLAVATCITIIRINNTVQGYAAFSPLK